MLEKRFYATGRRKSAIARVYMKEGSGVLTVNKRGFDDYFPRESLKMLIRQPFEVAGKQNQFDCYINVCGGGDFRAGRRREACHLQSPSGV
jgi:small subunit ribosomal protein S9